MKFSTEERAQLAAIAKSINVPEAAFLAVISVESNGIPGEVIAGKLEPLIRYEGHYFDKLCDPKVRDAARKAGVSNPKAGGVKNPKKQVDIWALVKKAATFDRYAAYASCSYGVGQVMGVHWKKLGFASIDEFIAKARSGLVGQAEIMAKFISVFGLDDELRNLDWSGFARGYNGSNFKKNNYDTNLAAAYTSFGGTSSIGSNRSGYIRLGSKGAGVRDIQALLVTAGYTINVDGDFGKTTQDALKAFQTRNGLTPDGIVGPKTQQALAGVRAVAPKDAGQPSLPNIKEVQQGAVVGIGVPATVEAIKKPISDVVDQISSYDYLANITHYLQTGLAIISVVGIVAGLGYAAYGWWKSRQSSTGTRSDDPVEVATEPTTEDLVSAAPTVVETPAQGSLL